MVTKPPNGKTNEIGRHLIDYGCEFYPNLIESAQGAVVRDADGREILDFTSGQMCAALGHSHPEIVAAIEKASREAIHLFSGMIGVPVVRLAEELASLLPPNLQKMIFLSTGAESNEVALRMAKLHTGRFEVLGLTGSWHGITAAMASITFEGQRHGYGPGMPGSMVLPAPYSYRCPSGTAVTCDMTCLEVGFDLVDAQSIGSLAAVFAEPILGASGVIVPPKEYFQRLKRECEKRGMLLIVDEAQTALGRCGANFAFEIFEADPDFLTISKSLGGGIPISAAVTSEEIATDCASKGFSHNTSHVSDPLPAEAARAVLRVLAAENICERVREMGAYLKTGLDELQSRHEAIGDIRGMGLLWGVDLVKDRETREPNDKLGAEVTLRCMALGLNMDIGGDLAAVKRIAPPLTVTKGEIDRALDIFDTALTDSQ